MKNYFSSDWHLGHKNIIKFDNRPFDTIEEMDKTIIRNYNSIVSPDDNFYYLGDFSFTSKNKTEDYLRQLNGRLFFIRGNHDKKDTIELYKKYGTYLGGLEEISIEGQKIILCHYAMKVWNGSHHSSYHLYGHSHHSLKEDINSLSFDVGCNGWDYKPLSFEEIKNKMDKKQFKAIDHHE